MRLPNLFSWALATSRNTARNTTRQADRRQALKRLQIEQLEARRLLAFLTPTLELAWSQSTADADYKYFPADPLESLSDAYFQTVPWDDNDFAEFYYYSQSGPPDPNKQLDAFSEGEASATGRVYLSPKESNSGLYSGFGYADVDIGFSFATVRDAAAQSNSEMVTKFLVVADSNDPEGALVNVRFTLSTYTEGIGSTGFSLEAPNYSLSGSYSTTSPNDESPVTKRTEIFQVHPGDELTLHWNVAAEGSAPKPDSAASASAFIRVGLEVVAPDLVIDGIAWDQDPENSGGVVFQHTVYEAPLTQSTSVELFWSSDKTPAGIIGGPIFARSRAQGLFESATETISAEQLDEAPENAAYLLAIYDRQNTVIERDEKNNYAALSLLPDLYPHSFEWLDDQRGVVLSYSIEFPKLAGRPQSLEQRTRVEVFWAENDTPIGDPIFTTNTQVTAGEYGPFVTIIPRTPAPKGATGLVAIIDDDNLIEEGDEENNLLSLLLTDLVGDLWDWNVERDEDRTKRGLDFAYYVNDANSRDDVEVEFYWATGPEFESRIRPAAGKRLLKNEGEEGYHGIFNEPARWGTPPPTATHLMFVLDPLNKIKESNEDNNFMAIPFHTKEEILAESITFEAIDTKILGYFTPGQGNITMSEAEVVLGVDHFNWVQQIISIPEHWDIVHNPFPTYSERVELPLFDPPRFVNNTNEIVVVDLDLARGERMADDPVDAKPFYYNEPNEIRRFTSSYELRFSDEPQFPHDFLLADEYVEFKIRLAGVSYDLFDVYINHIDAVTWKSNTVYDKDENLSGGVFLRVTEDMVTYPPMDGGVFDIQFVEQPVVVSWTNHANRWDVSGNNLVSAIDALIVINFLNRNPSGDLPSLSGDSVPPPFYDVNGSNSITPIDALMVINYLNRNPSGEGESSDRVQTGIDSSFWENYLTADEWSEKLRKGKLPRR